MLSTDGDSRLGGDDFDRLIAGWALRESAAQAQQHHQSNPERQGPLREFVRPCESNSQTSALFNTCEKYQACSDLLCAELQVLEREQIRAAHVRAVVHHASKEITMNSLFLIGFPKVSVPYGNRGYHNHPNNCWLTYHCSPIHRTKTVQLVVDDET